MGWRPGWLCWTPPTWCERRAALRPGPSCFPQGALTGGDGLGPALGCARGGGVPLGSAAGPEGGPALPQTCAGPGFVPHCLQAPKPKAQGRGGGRWRCEEQPSAVGRVAPCASPPSALLLPWRRSETSSAWPLPLQPWLRCCCSDFHLPLCLSISVAPAQQPAALV